MSRMHPNGLDRFKGSDETRQSLAASAGNFEPAVRCRSTRLRIARRRRFVPPRNEVTIQTRRPQGAPLRNVHSVGATLVVAPLLRRSGRGCD